MTTLAAGTLVIVVRVFFSEERVLALLEWIGGQGLLGPLLFVVVQCLFVIVLAPGFVLSFAAGFLFGFWPGMLYVWMGTTLGAVSAFELAPLVIQKQSDQVMKRFPMLARLDHGFSGDGWKIAMLRCLVPFFPFKLSNYAFGISRISLRHFTAGTMLGIVPIGAFNVYLGSISADLSVLGATESPSTSWEWVAIAGGGLAIAAMVVFVTRRAYAIFNLETTEEEV